MLFLEAQVPEVFQSSSQIWYDLRQRSYGRDLGISNTLPTEFVQSKAVGSGMQYGYEDHWGHWGCWKVERILISCILYTWTKYTQVLHTSPRFQWSKIKQIPSKNLCQDLIITFTYAAFSHSSQGTWYGPCNTRWSQVQMLLKLSSMDLPTINKVKKKKRH